MPVPASASSSRRYVSVDGERWARQFKDELPAACYRYLLAVGASAPWGTHLADGRHGPHASAYGPVIPTDKGLRRHARGSWDSKTSDARNALLLAGVITPGYMKCVSLFTGIRSWGKTPATIELGDRVYGAELDPETIAAVGACVRKAMRLLTEKSRGATKRIPPAPASVDPDEWAIAYRVRQMNAQRAQRREAIRAFHDEWLAQFPDEVYYGRERRDLLWSSVFNDALVGDVTPDDFVMKDPPLNADGTPKRGCPTVRYPNFQPRPVVVEEGRKAPNWAALDCSWNTCWDEDSIAAVREAIRSGAPLPDFAAPLPIVRPAEPVRLVAMMDAPEPRRRVRRSVVREVAPEPLYPESAMWDWPTAGSAVQVAAGDGSQLSGEAPETPDPVPVQAPETPAPQPVQAPEPSPRPGEDDPVPQTADLQETDEALIPAPKTPTPHPARRATAKTRSTTPKTPRRAGGEEVDAWIAEDPTRVQLLDDGWEAFTSASKERGVELLDFKRRGAFHVVYMRLMRNTSGVSGADMNAAIRAFVAGPRGATGQPPSAKELAVALETVRPTHRPRDPLAAALRDGAAHRPASTPGTASAPGLGLAPLQVTNTPIGAPSPWAAPVNLTSSDATLPAGTRNAPQCPASIDTRVLPDQRGDVAPFGTASALRHPQPAMTRSAAQ